jgi:hypothetical protein
MNDIIADLLTEAARIEREKDGQALTEPEAHTLKAVAFLQKILPQFFSDQRLTPAEDAGKVQP